MLKTLKHSLIVSIVVLAWSVFADTKAQNVVTFKWAKARARNVVVATITCPNYLASGALWAQRLIGKKESGLILSFLKIPAVPS